MDAVSLRQQFDAAFAVFRGQGKLEDLYAFLHDDAAVLDEDTPFWLSKAQFQNHVGFHMGGLWDSLEWLGYDPQIQLVGTTGVITTPFTLRGKPRDAGFRLRHGMATVVCHYDAKSKRWYAVTLVFGPLVGHLLDASPS